MTAARINPWRRFPGVLLPAWLLRQKDLSTGAKLAYGRLMAFAGEDGVAFPAMATLAAELGVTERHARRSVAELKAHGLVEQVDDPSRRTASRYYFLEHPWMVETGHARADIPVPPGGTIPSPQAPEGGHSGPPTPDIPVPPGGTKMSPKGIQGRDSEKGAGARAHAGEPAEQDGGRDDTGPLRCGTVERPARYHPEDALAAMARGSGGKLRMFASAALLVALGDVARSAQPRPLTLADFELFGRAWAAGAALAWSERTPDLGLLLRNGGEHLLGGVQAALAWDQAQRDAAEARERALAPAPPETPRIHPKFAAAARAAGLLDDDPTPEAHHG